MDHLTNQMKFVRNKNIFSDFSLIQTASHHQHYLHNTKESRQERQRVPHQSDELYQNGSYLGVLGIIFMK